MDQSNEYLRPLADLPASPYRFPQGHRVWGKPETARLQVSLNPAAYQEIMGHGQNQPGEVGGILLGFVFRSQSGDAYHISIEKVVPDLSPAGEASYRLDEASYAALLAERDRRFPQYSVVGWYHTRENAAILPLDSGFSPRQTLFTQPWQVELVVDPVRNEGYFYWVNEQGLPAALPGYYERIHPGFGWANWGKPAGTRAATAAAAAAQGEKKPHSYTPPVIAGILALVFLCALGFTFLNWQKAVADRDRIALDLEDNRSQLDQAIQRLRTLQPAFFLLNTVMPTLATSGTPIPQGSGTPEITPSPGTSTPGTQNSPTPTHTPTATNTLLPGQDTPTPEPTPTTGSGYEPPENNPTPTFDAGYNPP